ncbi:MAG: 30S ribosomal protein S8 [candidate division WOR-3 bacterium]|nr:30S ribosomal protein S8 [candidate division WOR-3 bacterium]
MDQIADMLTQIRNALKAKHKEVKIPYTKLKYEIARILLEEGYINNFTVGGSKVKKTINIQLKYGEDGKPAIFGLKRISHQSRRVYCSYKEIPLAIGGLGITILSTPKGVLTDREARKERVGGEVICQIW